MKTLFLLTIGIFSFFLSVAQGSDLLILKKNGRTVKTFFPGNEIIFNTTTRYYDAVIQSINHDSLFLVQYDVKQMPTSLGVYMLDTLGTYSFAVNYKEITGLGKFADKKFDWPGSGGALLGGGVLLTTVGLGTWIFTKPHTRYYASPYLVGGAALLAGIGYLLAKSNGKKMVLGKKYVLRYISVN
jgi:hypothetical protein